MKGFTVHVYPDGKVDMVGLDLGGKATLMAIKGDTLMVKIDGHTGWSGRGQRDYYPARIAVYEVERREHGSFVITREVIDSEIRPNVEKRELAAKTFRDRI